MTLSLSSLISELRKQPDCNSAWLIGIPNCFLNLIASYFQASLLSAPDPVSSLRYSSVALMGSMSIFYFLALESC